MATIFYQKKNNAKSTITNNPLTSGGLSITLASSTGALFPTTGATWLATIWSTNADPSVATDTEVVLIDSRSTDTLTVNASGRGYAGTTAVSHPTGSYIQLLVMKEHMTEYETAINAIENGTAWTTSTVPTYSGTGGLTFETVTTNSHHWQKNGKVVSFSLLATGTTGTSGAGRAITFTLPVTANASTVNVFTALHSTNGGSSYQTAVSFLGSTTTVNVYGGIDNSTGNFGDGAGRIIYVTGTYEAA